MRCRGQVVPTSRELVYEIFVREVHDGPEPTVWADLLCSVDGLKAFHAGRVGGRMVRLNLGPGAADRFAQQLRVASFGADAPDARLFVVA